MSALALSRTANGIAPCASRMSSARSSHAVVVSGDGTDVYQSRHSAPSAAAARIPSTCSTASGSSTAWPPRSVTGSMKRSVKCLALPTAARHEHHALEQVHVLLVLQQCAVQRRNERLAVGAAQCFRRDVLRQQQ